MHIIINALRLSGREVGFTRYASRLIRYLALLDHDNQYTVLLNDRDESLSDISRPNFELLRIRPPTVKSLHWWEQFYVPLKVRGLAFDVFHDPFSAGYPYPRRGLLVTVHDLVPLLYPQAFTRKSRLYWRWVYRGYSKVEQFVVDSYATGEDMQRLLKIPLQKISFIPLGLDETFRPMDRKLCHERVVKTYGLRGRYVLSVGTLQPRKNYATLLKAFAKFIRSRSDYCLAIVGGQGWLYQDIYATARDLGLADRVAFIEYVPDGDLVELYNGADLFVSPSLYEGFGFPMLEAMACGTPVIASNTSSVPEVVGDAGLLVNPLDVDALCEAMGTIIENPGLRNQLANSGIQRSKTFTWERVAQQTFSVYCRMSGRALTA